MTTCKNCRHWQPDKGSYGVCRKISDASDWQNRDPAVVHAWADDDSNLGCHLLTKPDFGCVSFEDGAKYEICPDCHCQCLADDMCWSTKDGAILLCQECWANENPDA